MRLFNRIIVITLAVFVTALLSLTVFAEVNRLDGPHDATNAIACGDCHVPVANIPMPTPRNWISDAVCRSCHSSGGTATPVKTHAVGDTMWCTNCHNPHQHQDQYMRYYIKSNVVLPNGQRKPLLFLDSTDFVHGTSGRGYQNYDGICETCHTQTAIYRNNPTGGRPVPNHQGWSACNKCHTHEEGFEGTCVQCHNIPGWNLSAHGNPQNPATRDLMHKRTCSACHSAHGGTDANMRLRTLLEENVCLSCHDGVQTPNEFWFVNATNVATDFNKQYKHPVTATSQVHNRNETWPITNPNAPRHVECIDCHKPHQARQNVNVGNISGTIYGADGVDMNGNYVAQIQYEYELCLKCHGNAANLPAGSVNKIAEFDTTNKGFHPVFGLNRNNPIFRIYENHMPTVTNKLLKAPWTSQSMMTCSDCHGSDNPNGPQGPHGSVWDGLLKKQFSKVNHGTDPAGTDSIVFALCYMCHDRVYFTIRDNETRPAGYARSDTGRWNNHPRHVRRHATQTHRQETCFACHDVHGADTSFAMVRWNTNDPGITRPDSIVGGQNRGPSALFGYYRFVNKVGTSYWNMRDTTLVGRDTIIAYCYVKCHGDAGNHFARTVRYRRWHSQMN